MIASFTGHALPILANWSQFLGTATLVTGLGAAYLHHKCSKCARWGRFKIGPHRAPSCKHHREHVQRENARWR